MDEDLHGRMVADVSLVLFSHHWALMTGVVDPPFVHFSSGLEWRCREACESLFERALWQVQNRLTAIISVSQAPENLVSFRDTLPILEQIDVP